MEAKKDEGEALPPDVARGRQQVRATLVTLGGSFVLGAFLGGVPFATLIVWLVVLALLGMQMFRGVKWARYLLAALTGILAASNGYQLVISLGGDGAGYILNGALVLVYVWVAFMLVMSDAIAAFTTHQRESREAAARGK